MGTLIVTEADLRKCLPLGAAALEATERAFTWLDEGRVEMPPVMHIDVGREGAVDTKSAYVAGVDHLAVKIATGFHHNPSIGLPSCSSTIALINAKTGLFDSVFLDNGYLMDLRTGMAGAVAAKYLAPHDVHTVGVVGTGVQARYQIECLSLVRNFERVVVYGRQPDRIASYCNDMSGRLNLPVEPCQNLESLIRASQIVVTTTHSSTPLISSDWVHEGLHITAMGSDLPGKQELEADVLRGADMLVCDDLAQCRIGGETQHIAYERTDVVTLGALTSGRRKFNRDQRAITVCDLTGTGAQDTAIATEAFARVTAAGLGTLFG